MRPLREFVPWRMNRRFWNVIDLATLRLRRRRCSYCGHWHWNGRGVRLPTCTYCYKDLVGR